MGDKSSAGCLCLHDSGEAPNSRYQETCLHQDASVRQPSALSDLLGGSTCMDVDVDSVQAELNAYTRVQ